MLSMFVVFSTLKLLGYITWPWHIVCIPLYYLFVLIIIGLFLFVLVHGIYKNIYNQKKPSGDDMHRSVFVCVLQQYNAFFSAGLLGLFIPKGNLHFADMRFA